MKRYEQDISIGLAYMNESECGDYVKHTDALAAVSAARADALLWVLGQLDSPVGLADGCEGDIPYRQRKSIQSERARLRAIIEKELGK